MPINYYQFTNDFKYYTYKLFILQIAMNYIILRIIQFTKSSYSTKKLMT